MAWRGDKMVTQTYSISSLTHSLFNVRRRRAHKHTHTLRHPNANIHYVPIKDFSAYAREKKRSHSDMLVSECELCAFPLVFGRVAHTTDIVGYLLVQGALSSRFHFFRDYYF